MYVKKLALASFRNFQSLAIEIPPTFTIIKGRNAQGKTNFLEAIYFLSNLKSPRSNKLRELIRTGDESAVIAADIEDRYGDLTLEVTLERGKRRCCINDKPVSKLEDFLGRLLTVSFFPGELELVKGSPQGRRDFLMRYLVALYPKLILPVLNYYRAISQKNSLLKRGYVTTAEIDAWNEILYREGSVVQRGLVQFVSELSEPCERIFSQFAPGDGGISLSLDTTPFFPEDPELALLEFRHLLQRERVLQRSLIGPHRTDLKLAVGGVDARAYASQGQSRSIVLALKLGILDLISSTRRESPVVLLDDVESELDRDRSEKFFGILSKGSYQIILTCTDKAFSNLLDIPETHVIEVEGGSLFVLT